MQFSSCFFLVLSFGELFGSILKKAKFCKAWRLTHTLSGKKGGVLKLVSNSLFTRKLGKTKNEISEGHVDPMPYNTQIDSFNHKSSSFTVLGTSLAEKKLY